MKEAARARLVCLLPGDTGRWTARGWYGFVLLVFAILALAESQPKHSGAETYTLKFSKSSNRMTWSPSVPGWSYAVPVALSAAGDTTAKLRLSARTNMGATLTERSGNKTWQDNISLSSSINYPVLGPRASIGINASMSSRSSTLAKERIRSQSYGFSFRSSPFKGRGGPFENLRFSLTPSLITAGRATRANRDSTIEEKGIQYSAALNVSPKFKIGKEKISPSMRISKRDNTLKSNKSSSESLGLSGGYKLPKNVRVNLSFSESRSQQGLTRAVIDPVTTDGEVVNDTTVASERSLSRSRSLNSSVKFKVAGFNVDTRQKWSQRLNTNTANAALDARNRFFARDRKSVDRSFGITADGKLPGDVVSKVKFDFAEDELRRLAVELPDDGSCPPPTKQIEPGVCRDPGDDRENRSLALNGSLNWQLSNDHTFSIFGSTRVSRGDNPGAREQDRDTSTDNASLSYRAKLGSGLNVNTTFSVNSIHRIFLDASRSSQNSRNRDLRLSISTSYKRLGANLSHGFEISARRTIFDFDRQVNLSVIDRQSNIRRSWTMRHSVNRSFFEALRLNSSFRYSADDLGTLLLERDAQIVEQDNADYSLGVGMSYRPSSELSCGLNYSYRLDRQWKIAYTTQGAERDLARRSRHRNLRFSTNYDPSKATSITGSASRSRQRSGTFDSFSVALTRRID